METVAFCEIDPFCRKVLKKHWPDIPIHEDIKELDGEQYRGTVDVVCGGFPCQPFSRAGKQRGSDDDRHLWPEMLRIIREVQPAWIIGENVAGIINMELDTVLSDLEALGYACQTLVIPACAVDAWHRRDRVWILAHSHSHSQSTSAKYAEASRMQESLANANANATSNGRQGRTLRNQHGLDQTAERERNHQQHGVASDTGGTRLEGLGLGLGTEQEYSALGDPCRWPVEPPVARVVYGLSGRLDRVRSLGNAVVPQIPEILGRAIMATAPCVPHLRYLR